MLLSISDCEVCSRLAEVETSFSKYGWDDMTRSLPESADRLVPIEDISATDKENNHIRRCPLCGVYYHYHSTYEYLVNGSEDEETLTRLTPTQSRSFLAAGEYEHLIAHHHESLARPDALTRSYAAKCLLSHYLAQGNLAAINELLDHPNRDVIYGALSFLASLAWDNLLPPETSLLRERITDLASSSDQPIAERAAYLLKYGLPGNQR